MTLRRSHPRARAATFLQLAAGFFALTGCVTIYQPFSALERPVAIDLKQDNLKSLKLRVECVPNEFMDDAGASELCEKVTTALKTQGAMVEQVKVGKNIENPDGDGDELIETKKSDTAPEIKPDLTVQLKSWVLRDRLNWWMTVPAFFTLSFVPVQREYVFASQVTIVSGNGFLLSTEVYQGRFVRYLGVGYWGLNSVFNWWFREEDEKISNEKTYENFSRDYYAHITQATYNARVRLNLMKLATATSAEAGAKP